MPKRARQRPHTVSCLSITFFPFSFPDTKMSPYPFSISPYLQLARAFEIFTNFGTPFCPHLLESSAFALPLDVHKSADDDGQARADVNRSSRFPSLCYTILEKKNHYDTGHTSVPAIPRDGRYCYIPTFYGSYFIVFHLSSNSSRVVARRRRAK